MRNRFPTHPGTFLWQFALYSLALWTAMQTRCPANMVPDEVARSVNRPNVLFIAVDDLNHWVGHLARNSQTKTPNIDRLAKLGVTFTNAHCAAPVCNPSRTALLSGRRPSTTGVYDNNNPFTNAVTSSESLVTQFRTAGYKTMGMGKLWHGGLGFPDQWSETGGRETTDRTGAVLDDRSIGGIRFGILNAGDEAVPDTRIADYGVAELQRTHSAPFFLTLGFHKPHMPWNVPKKYFDMHPLEQIELPPTQDNDLDDVPAAGQKMARAQGDHAEVLKSGRWKEAVQAYLAAISYLDGQIGRVLDALERSPYRDNTIICLWGDHGWHLGEKQHWRKFALWEEATRAPLIFVAPGVTRAGSSCHRPVDFMSIYPTLCELAHIDLPAHVEGRSIVRLLEDPASDWQGAALTTYGKGNHAIRTSHWRYIRYADGSEELYDHRVDPYEWKNVASAPELAAVKTELATLMPAFNADPVTKDGTADEPAKKNKGKQNNRKKKAAEEPAAVDPSDDQPVSYSLSPSQQPPGPNIVWVIVEDMSANFSCYGETNISTPNVDSLAKRGTRFTNAFVTAPICSISRSALITGRYQTSIGCQNHRSSVPGHIIELPDGVSLVPAMLKDAGYHVNNLTLDQFLRSEQDAGTKPQVPVAKTDYNFQWDSVATYDPTHWSVREKGKPFFVQVQLQGGKHRGQGNGREWPRRAAAALGSCTPEDSITLPAWLPNHPIIREDWAQYLDTVRMTDLEVGSIIQRLEDSGELQQTVIFFMTDHGVSHVRSKQFLYDDGIHVPLIVAGGPFSGGHEREDLVEHIDLAATSLALAGQPIPEWMSGRNLLDTTQPREFVYAARDRADETVDLIRSVRSDRWKYIWNGFPNRPWLQPNNYKDSKPILQAMRHCASEGLLNPQQALIMADTRPVEELYDLDSDPDEFHNLAGDPAYTSQLQKMRAALVAWQKRSQDPCRPEPQDVYLTEMNAIYPAGGRQAEPAQFRENVNLMLRWLKERPPLTGPPE